MRTIKLTPALAYLHLNSWFNLPAYYSKLIIEISRDYITLLDDTESLLKAVPYNEKKMQSIELAFKQNLNLALDEEKKFTISLKENSNGLDN